MATIKKHRRQWFISKESASQIQERLPGFRSMPIAGSAFLHHDEGLNVGTHQWDDGRVTIILGTLIGTPASPDALHYNAGRFVAITYPWLSLDATGSMGVYYGTSSDEIVCSSSCALVGEAVGQPVRGRETTPPGGMAWDPVPLARLPHMRKMFIDERLDLEAGTVSTAPRGSAGRMRTGPAAERLAAEMVGVAEGVAQLGRPIQLALTGGTDSRAVFAALVKAGVEFEAFTLVLENSRSQVDAEVAERLCSAYGIRYAPVFADKAEQSTLQVYDEHSGGIDGDLGNVYAQGNYYREIPDGSVVLHGGCFEIGQRYYDMKFEAVDFGTEEAAVKGLDAAFLRIRDRDKNALREWYRHRRANPLAGIDWVDAFYIDQRRGGWGADNRQAEDCFGFEWLILANSWRVIEPLLAVKIDARRANEVQLRAMDLLLPGINEAAPLNPRPTVKQLVTELLVSSRARKKAMARLGRAFSSHRAG